MTTQMSSETRFVESRSLNILFQIKVKLDKELLLIVVEDTLKMNKDFTARRYSWPFPAENKEL